MDFTLFPFTKLFWIGILAFWQWAPFNSFPMAGWQAGSLLAKLNFLQPRLGNPTICKAFFPQASFYGFQSFSEPTMCVALYWGFPRLHCLGLKMVVISSLPSFSVQHPEIEKIHTEHKLVFELEQCCIWTRLEFRFGGSRNWNEERGITLRTENRVDRTGVGWDLNNRGRYRPQLAWKADMRVFCQ